ncbi:sporulation protein YtxC [Halobacillus campisalis]|uniref:Sporulation protein YtxC n=1 Tax=Halobacillus campisalis TaxID=435909 RepID=A0ABW2K4U8_9BACI|nr:sporulation protein YtxC [Halobacillus campisalis]
MLVCVQFSNRKEALIFYQYLFDNCSNSRIELNGEIKDKGNKWSVTITEDYSFPDISQAVYTIIRQRKLQAWMEGVLRHRFYYGDPREIEQVIKLSSKLMEEPPDGVSLPRVDLKAELFVKRKVMDFEFNDFDDLSASCLEYVYQDLLEFTGKLLDEYKLEEAHQMMVDSWRRQVKNKRSAVTLLHVTCEGQLEYYFPEGNKVGRAELLSFLQSNPDPMIQTLPSELGILPALIYSPDELMIYSNKQGEAKLELLMNIFEEKAVWKPLSFFPFHKA